MNESITDKTLACKYKMHFINANAGSGKTTFLVQKIFEHVMKYQDLDDILCLTFSNTAAQEIMDRVFVFLQDKKINCSWNNNLAQTLHSFCLKLLQKYNPYYKILTSDFQQFLWEQSLNKILSEKQIEAEVLSNISLLQSYTSKRFMGALGKLQEEIIIEFEKYKEYESWLDFNDILIHTKALLQNELMSDIICKTFSNVKIIMIDESQDLSTLQWEIVHLILQDVMQLNGTYVYIVGDNKQSIYGFQGASVESANQFKEFYTQLHADEQEKLHMIDFACVEENFDHSYRCAKEILTLVDKIFQTKHVAKLDHKGYIENLPIIQDNTWMNEIISRIQDFIQKGIQNNEILILIRKRKDIYHLLEQKMKESGLSVSYQTDEAVISLCVHSALLSIHSDQYYYFQILQALIKLGKISEQQGLILLLNYENCLEEAFLADPILNILSKLYKKYQNNIFGFFEALLFFIQLDLDTIDTILTDLSNYIDTYNPTLYSCAQFFKNYKLKIKSNTIRIQTIHASKGQEAQVVFLCDTLENPNLSHNDLVATQYHAFTQDDTEYEGIKNKNKIAQLNEHKRLLYVAITRAKQHLIFINVLPSRLKNTPEHSWYAMINTALSSMNTD